MTQVEIVEAARGGNASYRVDASRSERIARVSSEWFSRPPDERYLSLSELFSAVRGRTERNQTRTVESAAIRVEANSGFSCRGRNLCVDWRDHCRRASLVAHFPKRRTPSNFTA